MKNFVNVAQNIVNMLVFKTTISIKENKYIYLWKSAYIKNMFDNGASKTGVLKNDLITL